jgi:hypothetical protein
MAIGDVACCLLYVFGSVLANTEAGMALGLLRQQKRTRLCSTVTLHAVE